MNKKKKTWQEILADNKGFPKVRRIDETKGKRWDSGTFVIPIPKVKVVRCPNAMISAIFKLVGRVTPCAPRWVCERENGSHGVTRPTRQK